MRTAALVMVAVLLAGCEMLGQWNVEKEVEKALANDQRTARFSFNIAATPEGVVNITGEVDTAADLDVVTSIAKAVKGVTSVINNCSYPDNVTNPLMDDTVVPGVAGGTL
jgi:hypothetical protein